MHDRKPTPDSHKKLTQAIADRENHINSNPNTKEYLNKLNAHMNHKYGGDRPMRKEEKQEIWLSQKFANRK